MIKSRRTRIVDELIDVGSRYTYKTSSEKFYGCEVCCTCKFFKRENQECILSAKDAKKSDDTLGVSGAALDIENYYVPVFIKKPTWFRCAWWEENE